MSTDPHYDEIATVLHGIRTRLDTLASINAENILIPGGPQERYHHIIEEAYVALGLIETQVDELRAELEYQYTRLDEARDAALAETAQAELYERDRKILELMGIGMADTRIAWEFGITEQQLDTFVSRIKQKTGLQSRADLEQLGRSIKDAYKRMN